MYLPEQEQFMKTLNTEELSALYFYTMTEGSSMISEYLRKGVVSHEKIETIVRILENIFLKIPPLTKSTTVYRGTRRKIEDGYIDEGYVSTTIDILQAHKFLKKGNCCLLKINVPKGAKVLPLYSLKGMEFKRSDFVGDIINHPTREVYINEEEFEIILDKKGMFLITEIQIIDMIECVITVYIPYNKNLFEIKVNEGFYDRDLEGTQNKFLLDMFLTSLKYKLLYFDTWKDMFYEQFGTEPTEDEIIYLEPFLEKIVRDTIRTYKNVIGDLDVDSMGIEDLMKIEGLWLIEEYMNEQVLADE